MKHLLALHSGRRLCFAGNADVVFHAGDLVQFAHIDGVRDFVDAADQDIVAAGHACKFQVRR